MAIKDILLPLVSYPKPTTSEAIEKSVAIAGKLGASISAITVELVVPAPAGPFRGAFTLEAPAEEETDEHRKSLLNSEKLMQVFETAARSLNVDHDQIIRATAAEDIATLLIDRARLKDVSLIAVHGHDGGQEKVIEGLLFESGRPVLLFSEPSVSQLSNSFDHVAIAWDHSAQSARAVADALPLCQNAKSVRIFTVTDDRTAAQLKSSEDLVKHLAQHSVEASFDMLKLNGSSIGKVFEAYVKTNKIDLLVMGAYRHSRLREFVLGGASYTVLGHPPCWVMMSH